MGKQNVKENEGKEQKKTWQSLTTTGDTKKKSALEEYNGTYAHPLSVLWPLKIKGSVYLTRSR